MRAAAAFALVLVLSDSSLSASFANGPLPDKHYKIVRPMYLMAVYESLNNRTMSREIATAFLNAEQYYKKSFVAFQCEVPVGTIMNVIGIAPKVWDMLWLAKRYFARLDPDPSQGMDVVVALNRGIEEALDGLNPDMLTRP